jgi:lipopolysaccharide export system protein LptC
MTHHEHVPDFRSRVVTILKVGLPLVALGMLSALFLIQTDDSLPGGGLVFTKGDMDALGEGLSVSNPVLTGTSQNDDRFRFTADRVVPDAAPPTRADLTNVAGTIDLDRGASIDLTAPTAALDLQTQRIALDGPIHITTSDGYDMRARDMNIDLAKGVLEATESVESRGPLGNISSGSLRVEPNTPGDATARLFSFGNGVRVLYVPPAAAPK